MADIELRAAITAAWVAKLESEGRIHRCGGCRKWMTKGCPQERLGADGRSRGPSCNAIACPEFNAAHGVAPTGEAQPQEPVAWGVIGADGKLLLAEKRTLLAYFDSPPRPLVWGDVGVVGTLKESDRG